MRITIMRGVPGSGKSTWVGEHRPDAVVVSADSYFMVQGEYKFDHRQLRSAHNQCKRLFVEHLVHGEIDIVVDNPNSQHWEYEFYIELAKLYGYKVLFHQMKHEVVNGRGKTESVRVFAQKCAERNVHGVPYEKIVQMLERWEYSE